MSSEQLTLFGPPDFHAPLHDTAVISARSDFNEHPELADYFALNGKRSHRAQYPEFDALKSVKSFMDIELRHLPTARATCPVCSHGLYRREEMHYDPAFDEDDIQRLFARTLREYCARCAFWQFHELRSALWYDRGHLADFHELTTVASKVRTFDEVPEDALCEIAQWFKRRPDLYQSVSPSYLEKLVAHIFAAAGHYSEVTHVGRPDDGGIDLVLVENDGSTWLVQVKRRESANASESVQTIRNLLGAMVLNDSRAGIVVSTADHFTQRAMQASSRAGSKGFRIDLVDRGALDRMLSQNLFYVPWKKISQTIEAERSEWFQQGPKWVAEKLSGAMKDGRALRLLRNSEVV